MKRFATVMAVLAALVLALAFTGCGNKTAYAFSSSEGSTITCYNDGTCDFYLKVNGKTYAGSGIYRDDSTKSFFTQTTIAIFINGIDVGIDSIDLTGPSSAVIGRIQIGTTETMQLFTTK